MQFYSLTRVADGLLTYLNQPCALTNQVDFIYFSREDGGKMCRECEVQRRFGSSRTTGPEVVFWVGVISATLRWGVSEAGCQLSYGYRLKRRNCSSNRRCEKFVAYRDLKDRRLDPKSREESHPSRSTPIRRWVFFGYYGTCDKTT